MCEMETIMTDVGMVVQRWSLAATTANLAASPMSLKLCRFNRLSGSYPIIG